MLYPTLGVADLPPDLAGHLTVVRKDIPLNEKQEMVVEKSALQRVSLANIFL